MPSSAASRARSWPGSRAAASSCARGSSCASPATSANGTTPSTARSRSSASSSSSSPPRRRGRSWSRARARSRRCGRRSARRIPPTPIRDRSAATLRRRCRTTSSMGRTRRSRRSARSRSGSRTMSSSEPGLPDSVARNVADWTQANADYTDAQAAEAWASEEIRWGVFGVPESELSVLGDVAGLDVVELGCGTAYFSAWLAKRGARPVGVDPTPAQLETARRMQRETGIEFPLVEAAAESVPLPDSSFDLALSEYGASLWAVPERWLPEAARLLRPGGRLLFLTNTPLAVMCSPADGSHTTEVLHRPQFGGLGRTTWEGEDGVEFHLPHGEMLDVLVGAGFWVERLVELRPREDAETRFDWITLDWARSWPSEEIWVARRAPSPG